MPVCVTKKILKCLELDIWFFNECSSFVFDPEVIRKQNFQSWSNRENLQWILTPSECKASGLGLALNLRKLEKMLSIGFFSRESVSGLEERTPLGHLLDIRSQM